jgi:hypothetical protein
MVKTMMSKRTSTMNMETTMDSLAGGSFGKVTTTTTETGTRAGTNKVLLGGVSSLFVE